MNEERTQHPYYDFISCITCNERILSLRYKAVTVEQRDVEVLSLCAQQ
jgi:hypothetical protein